MEVGGTCVTQEFELKNKVKSLFKKLLARKRHKYCFRKINPSPSYNTNHVGKKKSKLNRTV